jgi:hypothetical protein
MTGAIISGPGLGLQLPQNLYPSELQNAPYDFSTNAIALAPGNALPIPRGTFMVHTGMYSVIQYLDPITNSWTMSPSAAWTGPLHVVQSDGFNVRVANMLGCPVSAVVTALGTGTWVQASTVITPTPANGSTWAPIIGGRLALTGGTITTATAGAGYGKPPLVFFPAPPPASNNPNGVGGIPAKGWTSIANGSVNGFTFTNPGAGYATAPTVVLLPDPTDPNLATGITAATLTFTLTNTASLTGAICTNSGAALTGPASGADYGFTLSVTGAGAAASLSANILQTVIGTSITGAAGGYGTTAMEISTVGGVPTGGSIPNEYSIGNAWRPRKAQIGYSVTGSGSLAPGTVGTIYDGGLFLGASAPTPVVSILPLATTGTLNSSGLALRVGAVADYVLIQPIG